MPPEEEKAEPITAVMAATRLACRPVTIRTWARRYAARKQGVYKGQTVYDWHDLKTIDRCIDRGEKVPATPELRDELRASLSPAA
jgi:hypothetical protein